MRPSVKKRAGLVRGGLVVRGQFVQRRLIRRGIRREGRGGVSEADAEISAKLLAAQVQTLHER